jgi:hypothetical protein
VIVDGANRTDMKLAEATLDAILIARPMPTKEQPQHLCLSFFTGSWPLPRRLSSRSNWPIIPPIIANTIRSNAVGASWRPTAHGIRNEILAGEQKNEKHVPLTYRRDEGRRG